MLKGVKYPRIGICGLACVLCPTQHTDKEGWCGGCKSEKRMAVGCPFITCALKRKGLEFCWDCGESAECPKWKKHIESSRRGDSFVCYQRLEDNISMARKSGVATLASHLLTKEKLLKTMLAEFNEGRSKSYYCIAATVMETGELASAVKEARKRSKGLCLKEKAKLMHEVLDGIAAKRKYVLKLRH
jgi:hypothetical protein